MNSISIPSVAFITGAGSGIGRAVAERFLAEGWKVVVVGRRMELLEKLKSSAKEGSVLPLPCDLTDPAQTQKMMEQFANQREFAEGLKVLVNNAGRYVRSKTETAQDDHWRDMWEVNFLAPVRLTRHLLPYLRANQGAVINISSTLGLRPVAETGAYSAAKAALVNWTQTLALEEAPHKVRSNCICPGIVDTPIHALETKSKAEREAMDRLQPLGRVGRPEDIAHAVWSLSGPGSEWITGAILKVDGGIDLV